MELREGRLYFVVNGENLDITDRVSRTESFTYEYEDEQQVTHYWVVGLNGDTPDSYGYAEYLKTDTWIGCAGFFTADWRTSPNTGMRANKQG